MAFEPPIFKEYIPFQDAVAADDLNNFNKRLRRLEKLTCFPPLAMNNGDNPSIYLNANYAEIAWIALQDDLDPLQTDIFYYGILIQADDTQAATDTDDSGNDIYPIIENPDPDNNKLQFRNLFGFTASQGSYGLVTRFGQKTQEWILIQITSPC